MLNWIKRHKLLILLLIIVYTYYFIAYYQPRHTAINQQQVQGVKTNISLIIEPEDDRTLLDAIYSATREIHVVVYLLSDKEIIDALIAKDAEGLDVKVMLEEHTFGGAGLNKKSRKVLADGGVEVTWSNPVFALTHQKTIIIDDTHVFILNQNLTASAFDKNREFNIADYNLQDTLEIEKMFEADWDRTSFTPAESNLVISPYNSRAKLSTLLNDAVDEIDIEAEVLTDKDIINLLKNKAKTAKIMVIIPSFSKISANEKSARELEDSGVDVRTISSPYIHAKLLVTDDAKAYVGSINFTTQSMDENRELGIILSETEVIQRLTESFDSDWEKAVDYQ